MTVLMRGLWREMVEQLTKPKLTTTVGKPYTYKGIVETARGVPDKLGPKSSWSLKKSLQFLVKVFNICI